MALLEALKALLRRNANSAGGNAGGGGVGPLTVGELNRRATHESATHERGPLIPDTSQRIEITDEYRLVTRLLEEGSQIVFVSGKAGTGKSTLVQFLRNTYPGNLVVVAPTGVAALNVKGATIHSYFHLPPRVITDEDIKEVRDRRLYTKLDLLVIDEISMVRADLLDGVDKFLRLNGRHTDRPFGGTQLLLIGDLFQLPPVVTRAEEAVLFARKYTSPYFFSAKSLEECQLVPVELRKVFRQTDEAFIQTLDSIRVAERLQDVLSEINACCFRPVPAGADIVTLTATNAAADGINTARLNKLSGEALNFIGEISGNFSIEEERLPAPLNLTLKAGAQVMFTKSDVTKRWVNGTLGRVVGFKGASIQVELIADPSGTVHDVQHVDWESFKYEYDYAEDKIRPTVTGRYTQYPLMLAWAVTVHKSQGKTLDRVRIDLGRGAFSPGQVYVALSRCRSLTDITLARPIGQHEVKCDQRIKRFYFALADLQQRLDTIAAAGRS
jgi:ATP-dependent exoDNAse (exonuclease V) alpha subunit